MRYKRKYIFMGLLESAPPDTVICTTKRNKGRTVRYAPCVDIEF